MEEENVNIQFMRQRGIRNMGIFSKASKIKLEQETKHKKKHHYETLRFY